MTAARWDVLPRYPPDDAHLLREWRDVPLNPGHPRTGPGWNHDDHHLDLGRGPAVFAAARHHLLRYHFYPSHVMHHTADFTREGRPMRPGDRVVIRLRVLLPFGLPLLDILAMNEITTCLDQPRHVKIGYTTTAAHSGVGEWSAAVTHHTDDSVMLRVQSVSKMLALRRIPPVPQVARVLQLRAHRLGMAHLKSKITP